MSIKRTPGEIAEAWYQESEILAAMQSAEIPSSIHIEEREVFAKWMTRQYRLAMAKGIEKARAEYQPPAEVREAMAKYRMWGEDADVRPILDWALAVGGEVESTS